VPSALGQYSHNFGK